MVKSLRKLLPDLQDGAGYTVDERKIVDKVADFTLAQVDQLEAEPDSPPIWAPVHLLEPGFGISHGQKHRLIIAERFEAKVVPEAHRFFVDGIGHYGPNR